MPEPVTFGTLYLVPNTLGGDFPDYVIPHGVLDRIRMLDHFIVENEKAARAFLKKAGITILQDQLKLSVIDKFDDMSQAKPFMQPLLNGHDMGLLSDAGSPAVADPGSDFVKFAHESGIKVVPLPGPSSLLLALSASGLNGQSFCFHGYLPVTKTEKIARIRWMEKESRQKKQTQIFIETPYRNNAMLADLLQTCDSKTQLCIATDITLPTEKISTMSILMWKKIKTDLHKRPTVFLLLQY